MNVQLQRIDQDFHFEAVGASGVKVNIDAGENIGGHNLGARPMEMILMGLGGCSAIDVILILRKQKQKIEDLRIEIDAKRADAVPAPFTNIHMKFFLKGEIKMSKAQQAVELSVEKYCSVATMLEKSATITHEIILE
jgi:putative redox protein